MRATRLPEIAEPMPLRHFIEDARSRPAISISRMKPAAIRSRARFHAGPAAVLIGPEGGFTDEERAFVRGSGASPISLGPRILRAETAALACLSAYMALAGDWR